MNWEKIKEFLSVLLASLLVFLLMGNSGNWERATYSGSIVLILYYYRDPLISKLKGDDDSVSSKIIGVLVFLIILWLSGNFVSLVIRGVTNFDYCSGWAESEQYCAIQKIGDKYETDYQYDDY